MEMENAELFAARKERDALIDKLEEEFKASEEYRTYVKAFEEVDKLYKKYVEENAPIIGEQSYRRPTKFDFFFRREDRDIFKKYQAMEDALILKLSYGKTLRSALKSLPSSV